MSIYQGDTKIAGAINFGNKANIDSPALTGVPTAPTAAVSTNTTQLATTAFVNAEIANDAPTKTGSGASGTWGIGITGNAATATKLATARTLSLTGGVTGSLLFDGAGNASMNTTLTSGIDTSKLSEPGYVTSSITKTARPLFDVLRADRTAFLPAPQIIIETSTDAGVTWLDAGISDSTKRKLFTGQRPSISIPLKNGIRSTDCMMRITITGMKYNVPDGTIETDKYNYWNSTYVTSTERYFAVTEGWIWLCSLSDQIYLKVERATGGASTTWSTDREAYMSGWSGGNYFSLSGYAFGGGTSQTGNVWNWRFTFRTCTTAHTFDDAGLSTSYNTSPQTINHIKLSGTNVWSYANNYMYNDHLYAWDEYQNVTFPAIITGSQFTSNIVTGTAPLVVTSTTKVANLNADKLDDQDGSYYLDWTNMTNKPDPVITLSGDATGSVTLTDLASGTLAVTVVDDSHNHIISNVDGLQTALDAKASSTHTHGNITNAGAIGSTSGLAVVTTTSGVLTTGTVAIASGGTGATTAAAALTNLGITATATELNYTDGVTSNIQTQLSTKAPLASPALTGTPTAPTAAAGTNTTQVATTAFVENSAPFIISATAPTNTSKLWIDNSGVAYFYNGTAWVSIKGTYAD